jgi:hypothetical protein
MRERVYATRARATREKAISHQHSAISHVLQLSALNCLHYTDVRFSHLPIAECLMLMADG